MVKNHVDLKSVIVTDALIAYKGLDIYFVRHDVINHDKDEYIRGNVLTNTIEGFFAYLKRSILGIYHQVSVKNLQRYVMKIVIATIQEKCVTVKDLLKNAADMLPFGIIKAHLKG